MADVGGHTEGMDDEIEKIAARVRAKTIQFAQAVGIKTIAYLRSLTSEMQPGYSRGKLSGGGRGSKGAPRQAHPGHWADRTSILAASYYWKVEGVPNGARLTLGNSASYAKWLEDRNGYWVLSGAIARGGPVDNIIAELNAQFGFSVVRV